MVVMIVGGGGGGGVGGGGAIVSPLRPIHWPVVVALQRVIHSVIGEGVSGLHALWKSIHTSQQYHNCSPGLVTT